MRITERQLRRVVRGILLEAVPSQTKFKDEPYDPVRARAFNDPVSWPDEIIQKVDEVWRMLDLKGSSYTNPLSGRVTKTRQITQNLETITSLAKSLNKHFEERE
jgi:hypothetical protein